jgi:hypothetical protein
MSSFPSSLPCINARALERKPLIHYVIGSRNQDENYSYLPTTIHVRDQEKLLAILRSQANGSWPIRVPC